MSFLKLVKNYNKKIDITNLKLFLDYISPFRVKVIIIILIVIISIFLQLLDPFIWGKVIDSLVERELDKFWQLLIIMAIIIIANYIVIFLKEITTNNSVISIINNIRKDIFKTYLKLPIEAFDKVSTGEFISRMNGDIERVIYNIVSNLIEIIQSIILVIVLGIALFSINYKLSLIVILTFPITILIINLFSDKVKLLRQQQAEYTDEYYSFANEVLNGIREIKFLSALNEITLNFNEKVDELRKVNINLEMISNIALSTTNIVKFLVDITIMILGGFLVIQNKLSLSLFIAFIAYAKRFSRNLHNLTKLNHKYQQVSISIERLNHILKDNMGYEIMLNKESIGKEIVGKVKFQNIVFSYENSNILDKISFNILPNTKNYIIGSNGTGKTTILNLLIKFYKLNLGNILIDGIDINEFSEDEYYNQVSIVTQQPVFFNRSIMENLTLGMKKIITDKEIIEVCKKVNIHKDILQFKKQYSTVLKNGGTILSVGQKQKLAIARALLRKPKLLLLDEPTSALDYVSQKNIYKLLDELAKESTIIIITHQKNNIREEDNVIELRNNKVGAGSVVTNEKRDVV